MDTLHPAQLRLDPDTPYSIRQLARALGQGRGTAPLYRAIRRGHLRAATLNDRGDLLVMGRWALDWLESLANPRSAA
jgi:hypothetical protein